MPVPLIRGIVGRTLKQRVSVRRLGDSLRSLHLPWSPMIAGRVKPVRGERVEDRALPLTHPNTNIDMQVIWRYGPLL